MADQDDWYLDIITQLLRHVTSWPRNEDLKVDYIPSRLDHKSKGENEVP